MKDYPVAIVKQARAVYPETPPFHPPSITPELQGMLASTEKDETNLVYASVRKALHLLGRDQARFGSAGWNPLAGLIRPGDTVVLKPNMLTHKHVHSDDWDYCITHGAVIRAVCDYVFLALEGKGRIIIADGPQHDSDVGKILGLLGIGPLQEFYARRFSFPVDFIDLRDEKWIEQDGIYTERVKLAGDPAGSVIFDLGRESLLAELDRGRPRFYGCYYDICETQAHHSGGRHEYAICRTPLLADVFINIPKLKTHKKCGLTVNLKSVVGGLNANKNYLPHYRIGSPEEGGDQFGGRTARTVFENMLVVNAKKFLLRKNPAVQYLARKFKGTAYRILGETDDVVRSGNWYGNDTVWRMCLDLNRILAYGREDGTLAADRPKRFLSVVDGVLAMEGNGPISGTKKAAGLIIAGDSPVSVDAVCARIMGFDVNKTKLISRCFDDHPYPLFHGSWSGIRPLSDHPAWNKPFEMWRPEEMLNFRPHFGWRGQIEWEG